MSGRIVIAAGGTGGHMFPAQALGESLMDDGWHVSMMTDARGRGHVRWLPDDRIFTVEAASITPRKPVAAVRGLLTLGRGTRMARRIMTANRPDVVAGFGGYPAFPALRAAQSLNIPYILHEQNTVLGRVNRLFARRAHTVATGFDAAQRLHPQANHVPVGNPLRRAVLDAVPSDYTAPEGDINLLVVGGSLGARIIAQTLPRAIARLPDALRARLNVVQQTTEGERDTARRIYADAGVRATLDTFFADIQTHLAAAHLIVGRAGASSVSEFAVMGKPTILVPLAIAMDDHQTTNARTLERLGAAVVMPESTFTPDALAQVLEDKLGDTAWLESAATAAKSAAIPDATQRLAAIVRRLAPG